MQRVHNERFCITCCILQVTFDKGVQKRSVSLAGDVFDPSGTLTGGSRPQTQSILAQLGELCEAEAALQEQDRALTSLEKELTSIQAEAAKYVTVYIVGHICPVGVAVGVFNFYIAPM